MRGNGVGGAESSLNTNAAEHAALQTQQLHRTQRHQLAMEQQREAALRADGDVELSSLTEAGEVDAEAINEGVEDPNAADTPTESKTREALKKADEEVEADRDRPLDPAGWAKLVNKHQGPLSLRERLIKGDGKARTSSKGAKSSQDLEEALIDGIPSEDVEEALDAVGLTPKQKRRWRWYSALSGVPNPLPTYIMNSATYIGGPATALFKSDVKGFGVSFASATSAPALNSLQQPIGVEVGTTIRQLGYTVENPSGDISDKKPLTVRAADVTKATEAFEGKLQSFTTAYGALMKLLEERGHTKPDEEEALSATLASLDDPEVEKAVAKCSEAADSASTAFDVLAKAEGMAQAAQGTIVRQKAGNFAQRGPRTLRPFLSGLASFSKLLRGEKFPSGSTLGIEAGLAGGLMLAQLGCSAYDSYQKEVVNLKLNLLHADVLTKEGRAKLALGGAKKPKGDGAGLVTAADVDKVKLHGLMKSPIAARLDHAKVALSGMIAAEEKKALKDGTNDEIEQEEGQVGLDGDTLISLKNDLTILDEAIAGCKPGAEGKTRLYELDPDGIAAAIMTGNIRRCLNQISRKYGGTEIKAQVTQRYGQAFLYGVCGNAVPSFARSAIRAGFGDKHKTVADVLEGVTTLASTAAAGYGSSKQHLAITLKNNRRGAPDEMSTRQQLWRSLHAPDYFSREQKAIDSGYTKITAAGSSHQNDVKQLDDYIAAQRRIAPVGKVVAGPKLVTADPTSSNMTIEQAHAPAWSNMTVSEANKLASRLNFRTASVRGDGNCLFRALAVLAGESENNFAHHRQIAVDAMAKQSLAMINSSAATTYGSSPRTFTSGSEYRAHMMTGASGPVDSTRWGTIDEAGQWAAARGAQLHVYVSSGRPPMVFGDQNATETLHLAHVGGNHFIPMLPVEAGASGTATREVA